VSTPPQPDLTGDPIHSQAPAAEPADPPHYAGHTPGYGPNPTAQGVRGYRDLPPDDVALINAIKELQENVADVWAATLLREGTDQRWANIAKTHLEEGVSALVRSVAKPHDPFRSALVRLQEHAEQRARQAVERDLERTRRAEGAEAAVRIGENILAQEQREPKP